MNKTTPANTRTLVAGVVAALALTVISPVGDAKASTEPSRNQAAVTAGAAPGAIARQLPNHRLAGEGLLRWFGFRIYRARFFVSESYDHARPMQGPIALEMTYKRNFDGQSIAERSADEIESLGIGSQAQRRQWAAQMATLFPNIAKGDRLAGILTTSGQTLFLHNEKNIGQIDDPAFGRAFFAIWLDERTSAPGLRAQLIGKDNSPAPLYESAQ